MAAFRGRCKNHSDAAIFEGRCSEPSCPRTPSQTDEVRCSRIMLSRRYRWLLTRMIAVFVWFLKGEKNDSDSGTVQSDACTVPNSKCYKSNTITLNCSQQSTHHTTGRPATSAIHLLAKDKVVTCAFTVSVLPHLTTLMRVHLNFNS